MPNCAGSRISKININMKVGLCLTLSIVLIYYTIITSNTSKIITRLQKIILKAINSKLYHKAIS